MPVTQYIKLYNKRLKGINISLFHIKNCLFVLSTVFVVLLSTPAHTKSLCAQLFSSSRPASQRAQYYIEKDVFILKTILNEYLNFANTIHHESQLKNTPLVTARGEYLTLFNEFNELLMSHSRNSFAKQKNLMTQLLNNYEMTDPQKESTQDIIKKHREATKLLKKNYIEIESIKFKSINHSRRVIKRTFRHLARQHQFLQTYTHSLLNQFIEVISLRPSLTEVALPSAYHSLNWKHKGLSDKLWEHINKAPALEYNTNHHEQKNNIHQFNKKIDEKLTALKEALFVLNVYSSHSLSDINTHFSTFKKANLVNLTLLEEGRLNHKEFKFQTQRYVFGLTQGLRSKFSEAWVLSRLPIDGHEYFLSIKSSR